MKNILVLCFALLTLGGCYSLNIKNQTAILPKQPVEIIESTKTDIHEKLSLPVEKYQLDNGLTVLLSEDHATPFVAVNLWYYVGAINEQPQRTGLAHLFEHLMFEGSTFVPDALHFRLLEKAGGFDINASTGFERTNYYQTVPKSQLELVLSLEASRMFFLTISQAKLDEQRAVVRREREQRLEVTPYGTAWQKLWQSIFDKKHPFHGQIIGSHHDLEAATLTDVQQFYDRFYGPSNACLTLVGDFDKAQAKALIDKYFKTLPKTRSDPTPLLTTPSIDAQQIITVEEKIGKLPLVRIQYLTPGLYQAGDAELDVLSHVLTGGEFGRLTKALTRDKQLAASTVAYQQSHDQVSVFCIDTILNPQVSPHEVIQKIDQVLLDLAKTPPSSIEIERAVNSLLTHQFFALQSLGGQSGRAELLQTYNRFAHRPDFLHQDIMRYQKVNSTSLQISARNYLPIGKARKILIAKPVSNQVSRQRK